MTRRAVKPPSSCSLTRAQAPDGNLRGNMLISHLVPSIVSYFRAGFKNRLAGVSFPVDRHEMITRPLSRCERRLTLLTVDLGDERLLSLIVLNQ